MRMNELMSSSHDHIMANTWRLIFERPQPISTNSVPRPIPDFAVLEELLPEYRLIGLCLADSNTQPRRN